MAELFITFFKLGLFTIGGGIAMIPILRDIMVNDKRWFTDEEMVDIITISQSMPGVVAINMATYVGFKRRGFFGSLVSTTGVTLPSFIIILIIAKGLSFVSGNTYVAGLLGGLKAAAVGMVIVAVWQLGRSIFKDAYSVVGGVAAFVMIAFLKINVAYVILLFLALGIVRVYLFANSESAGSGTTASGDFKAGEEDGGETVDKEEDGGDAE